MSVNISDKIYEELKGFDPLIEYRISGGHIKEIREKCRIDMMETCSGLLTTMMIKGATDEDIIKVIKHSMVICKCKYHLLDWKKSIDENDINRIVTKYYGGKTL